MSLLSRVDGLAALEDLCGPVRVSACLKPGERHPGPCAGSPGNRGWLRRLLPRRARPKTAPAPPIVGHQRARGQDILADLDMTTIGALSKRVGGTGRWRSGQHDAQLAAIASAQGFDGLPRLVEQAEFDRLKAAPRALPLYRGVNDNDDTGQSGEQIAAHFRHGPVFYGQGWSGNGIYTSSERGEALGYTTGNNPAALNEMVLDPAARTVTLRELRKQMDAAIPADTRARLAAVFAAQRMTFEPGRQSGELVVAAQAMKRTLQPQDWLWMDPSAFAMARGYDAVYHGKDARFPTGEWVLLNRTAVATLVPPNPPRTLQELYPEPVRAASARARVQACRPPHLAVPKPGPCPGRAGRGARPAVGRAVGRHARRSAPAPRTGGPGTGRDLSGQLDFQRIGQLPKRDGQGADLRLAAIAKAQGFDAAPRLGDPAELDAAVAAGGLELWRGVTPKHGRSAAQIHDQFVGGDAHFGQGNFGNGIYFTDQQAVARHYAGPSGGPDGVQRIVLPRQARTIAYADLADLMRADPATRPPDKDTATRALLASLAAAGGDPQASQAAWADYEAQLATTAPQADPGLWGMTRGHDAVIVPMDGGGHEVILLNRGAALAERARRDRP